MRIYHAVLIILPILIAFSQASSSITVSMPFTPGQTSPLSSTSQVTYPLSPANPVYNYNTQNALYLITCPQAPNAQNGQLFTTTGSQLFGEWMLSGNSCQPTKSAGSYPVTATITDKMTAPDSAYLPSAAASNATVTLGGAAYTYLANLGYSPEVQSGGLSFVSSDFNSKSYIFGSVPVRGQDGIWTWTSIYADLAYMNGQLQTTPLSASNSIKATYSPPAEATCEYTYTLNSQVLLTSIQNTQLPFVSQGTTIKLGLLPYFIYDANIANSAPSGEFNFGLSYDVYSPTNYGSAQGRIEPFTLNSLGLLMANISSSFAYVNNNGGDNVNLASADNSVGIFMPILLSAAPPTVVSAGTCPNQFYAPTNPASGNHEGTGPPLTIDQVVACAQNAGFTKGYAITIVAMAYQESGWDPGDTEPVFCAAGILQEGHGVCFPPKSSSVISGYSASSCSTFAKYGWEGVYYNPTCAFQWAYAEVQDQGFYPFWGSYETGAYCKWAPNGFKGVTDPAGGITVGCSGTNQNQENANWPSSLAAAQPSGQANSIISLSNQTSNQTSNPTSSSAYKSILDAGPFVEPQSLTATILQQAGGASSNNIFSITLNAISITSTANGYVYVLASSPTTTGLLATTTTTPPTNGVAGSGPCLSNPICAAAYSQLGPKYTHLSAVPYCYGGYAPRGTNPFHRCRFGH